MTTATPSHGPQAGGPEPGTEQGTDSARQAQTGPSVPPFQALVQTLLAEWGLALHDRMRLLMLEVRQAGINAAQMVLLATVTALMLCGAWVTLMVGIYMGSTQAGLHWALALLLVLALHLMLASLAWLKAMALSTALTLPASLRVLKSLLPRHPEP